MEGELFYGSVAIHVSFAYVDSSYPSFISFQFSVQIQVGSLVSEKILALLEGHISRMSIYHLSAPFTFNGTVFSRY